ncbi:UPF0246 protein YaaA [Seminavis robusta]|uniref:UPF0246 protein YaaA n=1 Tax=Seminavis robusta TaxID=568900 RepID=A0A9N8EFL6_9STRA|nr:UPF0246 protein YaaA [Seminavis robusta]|eukprot:Sro865_g212880.1 UPF0246 protein YaaA (351) ;mRNA; f:30902-32087
MPKTSSSQESKDATGGIMMILSPAKTLDLDPLPNNHPEQDNYNQNIPDATTFTMPDCHTENTLRVVKSMKTRTQKELEKLLGISANLAKKSHEYWNDFQEDPTTSKDSKETTLKPAIYAFSGAAYQGLQALERSKDAILYMQNNLRIVDPVYGILKPLDQMQAYRLEMATRNLFDGNNGKKKKKNDNDDNKNALPSKLNVYWKDAVTQQLSSELATRPQDKRILLNLASDEYSAALDGTMLQKETPSAQYIKVVFRNEGRVIAVHAKRARGLMVRYLAERQATTLEDVKQFDLEGYKLVEDDEDDDDASTLIFDRPKQAPPAKAKAAGKKRAKDEEPTNKKKRSTRKRKL